MFLEASAVCGILANEEYKDILLAKLEAATTPLTTYDLILGRPLAELSIFASGLASA
jgi:hypothetical protein